MKDNNDTQKQLDGALLEIKKLNLTVSQLCGKLRLSKDISRNLMQVIKNMKEQEEL